MSILETIRELFRGQQGLQGNTGRPGADGRSGAEGLPGRTGDRGEEGPRGHMGRPGKDGQDGLDLDTVSIKVPVGIVVVGSETWHHPGTTTLNQGAIWNSVNFVRHQLLVVEEFYQQNFDIKLQFQIRAHVGESSELDYSEAAFDRKFVRNIYPAFQRVTGFIGMDVERLAGPEGFIGEYGRRDRVTWGTFHVAGAYPSLEEDNNMIDDIVIHEVGHIFGMGHIPYSWMSAAIDGDTRVLGPDRAIVRAGALEWGYY